MGGVWGRGRVGGVRVDVIEELKFLGKFTQKNWGWGSGGSGWWVGQDGCERRIEVFVQIHKKKSWGGSGGEGVSLGVGLVGGTGWM